MPSYRKSDQHLLFLLPHNYRDRCSNPASTVEEFGHQIQLTKPTLIIASPELLDTVVKAGKTVGVTPQRIVSIDKASVLPPGVSRLSVVDLIAEGMKKDWVFVERRLAPGEAKTKTALYCFSSGTTGSPKVRRDFLPVQSPFRLTISRPSRTRP